jgi:hypothetical protein
MRYAEFQEPSTWSGGANPASPKRPRGADCNVWGGVGWVGEGWAGVHVFAPDGTLIGVILLPEICANYVFGGAKAQPAVHGGEPLALRRLHCHPGRIPGLILPLG